MNPSTKACLSSGVTGRRRILVPSFRQRIVLRRRKKSSSFMSGPLASNHEDETAAREVLCEHLERARRTASPGGGRELPVVKPELADAGHVPTRCRRSSIPSFRPRERVGRKRMPRLSAGPLLYGSARGLVEMLLVHPGGPYWARRDGGSLVRPRGSARWARTRSVASTTSARSSGQLLRPVPGSAAGSRGSHTICMFNVKGDRSAASMREDEDCDEVPQRTAWVFTSIIHQVSPIPTQSGNCSFPPRIAQSLSTVIFEEMPPRGRVTRTSRSRTGS